ncbi:hypothetical protein BSKO_11317 [Bryopsis sp. KO-2023]|nr:hypothetical protein BSKO_11317 [Bryopsis sp. KO-2023]
MVRVVIICTSNDKLGTTGEKTGLWLEELAAAYNVFVAAGFEVTIASMKGGKIPLDETSLQPPFKTPDCDTFLANDAGVKAMNESVPLSALSQSDFDVLYLPGGHGVCYDMPQDPSLAKLLGEACDSGKIVSSVCHGPAAFASAKLASGDSIVNGKKVTGFSNSEEEAVGKTAAVPFLLEDRLKELGGSYSSVEDWNPHTVVDGKLVTGQNPGSSTGVAQAVVALLKT